MRENEAFSGDILPKQIARLCFVIGPIGEAGSAERKRADMLLQAVVRPALELPELGYVVKRSDDDADPGSISDRMITDVIGADLVVADLTDRNPNAFYELGIRHATLKPTVHIAQAGTLLPFDNAGQRTIFVDLADWHDIERARLSLTAAAKVVGAQDYKTSNPITQANASFAMRNSTDPTESFLADLRDRVAEIETKLDGVSIARNVRRASIDTEGMHNWLARYSDTGRRKIVFYDEPSGDEKRRRPEDPTNDRDPIR